MEICAQNTDRLSTNFAFIPRTVAEPPSALRARAYAESGVILGPDADPEGWKVYDPIKITGTLFGTREVSVQCTVRDPFDRTVIPTPLSQEATYAVCVSDTRACISSLSHTTVVTITIRPVHVREQFSYPSLSHPPRHVYASARHVFQRSQFVPPADHRAWLRSRR